MTATVPLSTVAQARATTIAGASPEEAIEAAKLAGAEVVDVRFTDLPGTWQHFSLPVRALTPAVFDEGLGFDGSSIRGFQQIHESDMLLMPDPASGFLDPCLRYRPLC